MKAKLNLLAHALDLWSAFCLQPLATFAQGMAFNITVNIQDDGTTKTLIVNPPTGNRFYRLHKP